MKKITNARELRESILMLENKRAEELRMMKNHISQVKERMKPGNIIRNLFSKMTESPELKGGLMNTGIAVAASIISRKVLVGSSRNPVRHLIGSLLQMVVTGMVSRHSDAIKSGGASLVKKFISKRNEMKQAAPAQAEY